MKWLPRVIKGIEEFMDEHGYPDIPSMHGIASNRAAGDYSAQFRKERITVTIDDDACKNPTCTVCMQLCFYEALSQADGKVEVHPENCIGCELCYDACPFGAVKMEQTTPEQLVQDYFRIPERAFETNKFTTQRNNPDSIGWKFLK
jgi:dihydroorotate dehydrogenase (fumarate)/dihydropyrimidine dehydrogenase (NAD+) subunit PreA